jgi:hypothetical protein
MNAYPFENLLEMNRAAFAPVVRWQELSAEATQRVVQHNLNVARNCMDFGVRQAQLLGELKDPQRFGLEAARLAADLGQKMLEQAGDYFKIVRETQDAVGQWAETAAKASMDACKAPV